MLYDDAYKQFINNNSSIPSNLNASNSLLMGFSARINVGVGLPEQFYIIFSPSAKYSWRFDDVPGTDMIETSAGRLSFEFTIAVAKAFY